MAQVSALVDRIVPSRRAAQAAQVKCKEQQQQRVTRHEREAPREPENTSVQPAAENISQDDVPATPTRQSGKSRTKIRTPTRLPNIPVISRKTTPAKPLRRTKSLHSLNEGGSKPPYEAAKLRFDSPLSESSGDIPPAGSKRKAAHSNGTTKRKRAKIEQPSTVIQDLLRTADGQSFVMGSDDDWSLHKLTKFVYVRLGDNGCIVPFKESFDKPPGYWWPAKVRKARLFHGSIIDHLPCL